MPTENETRQPTVRYTSKRSKRFSLADKLKTWLQTFLDHAILGGICIVTVTVLIYLIVPTGTVYAGKYLASIGFGVFVIVAGLMDADFG